MHVVTRPSGAIMVVVVQAQLLLYTNIAVTASKIFFIKSSPQVAAHSSDQYHDGIADDKPSQLTH